MKYSAKMLLLAFQVQRKSILNFGVGVCIRKEAKSLTLVAKRLRLVEGILAVGGWIQRELLVPVSLFR